MYGGQCRDVFDEGICGLGERLWFTEPEGGRVECNCDEVEYKYQVLLASCFSTLSLVFARVTDSLTQSHNIQSRPPEQRGIFLEASDWSAN